MSILKKLLGLSQGGSSPSRSSHSESSSTESVRRIVRGLEQLDPPRARFIAAFAYILGRVAHADLDISETESRAMEDLVREHGGLPEDQTLLVVEIAKSQNRLFGGTENFLVTREFAELASRREKLRLLDCLFAVSAADDSVSVVEEEQVRGIARELGLTHREYVEARARYSGQREVLRGLRRKPGSAREDD